MKKMYIYEKAMCCSTGLCGVSVDPELLRISTVKNNLEKNGVVIERYNLTNAPMEFIKNQKVNELISKEGTEILPITVVDTEIVKTKQYPTNDEISSFLAVPKTYLILDDKIEKSGGCGCSCGCNGGC